MIKKICVVLFCLGYSMSYSQKIAVSPYSSFGLGDFKFDNDAVLNGMGGVSTAYVSEVGNEINFTNPAANQNVYFTTFNISGNSDLYNLKSATSESEKSNTYVSNMSIGFPISKKVKFGVGFQPYTGLGYEVFSTSTNQTPNTNSYFSGNGGLNSLHTITSYSPNKTFSFGIRLNYLFGSLEKYQETSVEGAPLVTGESRDYELRSFQITPGITYSKLLNKKYKLIIGATFGIPMSLKTENNYSRSTFYFLSTGDRINESVVESYSNKSNTTLPANYSFGASIGKEQKWMLGMEFKGMQLSDLDLPDDDFEYSNKYRFATGGWIIPNRNSYRSYFAKVTYRFGLYYENTGLTINDTSINQYGLDFGFGFPVGTTRQSASMINVGFELGQRGTTSNDLFRENFAKIKIGFNLSDRWFRRATYD